MAETRPSRQALIALYKTILREFIEQRPSGIRQKIAQVLGTHKSFISQISNPSDPTPIPARHLDPIIDVCHLAPPEQQRFLDAYRAAHPRQALLDHHKHQQRHYKTLHIQVPVLSNPDKQQLLEQFIHDTVRRMCGLMTE